MQETQTDYSNVSGSLKFARTYKSSTNKWTHNYQSAVINLQAANGSNPAGICHYDPSQLHCFPYATGTANVNDIAVYRGNANRMLHFSSSQQYTAGVDINDKLVPITASDGSQAGWSVTNGDTDAVEIYDVGGRLQSSRSRDGEITTFLYSDSNTPITIAQSPGMLLSVTDSFGAQLLFTYDSKNNLATMTDPAGGLYLYTYDVLNNLTSVTYPDGKSIQYVYAEPAYVPSTIAAASTSLTGIIDENGQRYATITYNSGHYAIGSWLGDGAEKYSFSYSTQTSVTDPLGTSRIYKYATNSSLGITQYLGVQQPGLNGTAAVSSSISYDNNGNVTLFQNFSFIYTKYIYDLTRNLPITQVDAYNSPSAVTTSTAWHPSFALPMRIAEPKRLTINTYDDYGRLLSRSVQATSDATGTLGFNAALLGKPRVWSYTYNQFGQMLSAKGPRTDVNDVTTYTYDDHGNLTSVTNAAGHQTTFANYDANGRVGTATDPNGLATTFTYTPRGWLSSQTVGDQTTSYGYDGAGQLTSVTLPDNSVISYTYDNAHRLTRVGDSLGNSIAYTLDAIGNRTAELVTDPNGALTSSTTRVFDALNQLKSQTGRMQ